MSGPRRSSGSWRQRQERDPYVQKARREGWRSRAVFKLEQIVAREPILRRGMTCVDLGAAPGGWSQYTSERLHGDVRILAVDIIAMDSVPSVEFIQGDFTQDAVLEALLARTGPQSVDLVMSDMAPNISGNRSIDQPRAIYLAERAFDLARKVLKRDGTFICKLFQGEGSDALVAGAKATFGKVRVLKPKASRPGSSEVYLVARNYRL